MHQLAKRPKEIIKIFKVSHPEADDKNPDPKYHVPFLPNFLGKSPLHNLIAELDYKTTETVLSYLKYYKIDHHSRAIKTLYGELISKQLPEFMNYLESRFNETEQT